MSFEEKIAWMQGVVAVLGYGVYLGVLVAMSSAGPVNELPYQVPMLATIVGALVVTIIGSIIIVVSSPRTAGKKDQRDRQIYRFGEYTGQSFVVIGGVAAMLMALAQWEYFWIANVLYLCFVLSAILGTIVKAVAYRRGLPEW